MVDTVFAKNLFSSLPDKEVMEPFKAKPLEDLMRYILGLVDSSEDVRAGARRVCLEHDAEPTEGFLNLLVLLSWDKSST